MVNGNGGKGTMFSSLYLFKPGSRFLSDRRMSLMFWIQRQHHWNPVRSQLWQYSHRWSVLSYSNPADSWRHRWAWWAPRSIITIGCIGSGSDTGWPLSAPHEGSWRVREQSLRTKDWAGTPELVPSRLPLQQNRKYCASSCSAKHPRHFSKPLVSV
jgi:hypothetical protein